MIISNQRKITCPTCAFLDRKRLYPLIEEGLLEMIEEEKSSSKDEVLCISKAWQGLWPNTFSPENVKIIDFTLLSEAVGFRVVKEV